MPYVIPPSSQRTAPIGQGYHPIPGAYPTSKTKKKKGSFLGSGFVPNLFRDVESAALGLGPGLIELGRGIGENIAYDFTGGRYGSTERLGNIARGIGQQYSHQYGPLLHGDIGTAWHRFTTHPLGPLIDVSMLFSGGTTGAVKGAKLLERSGAIEKVPKFLESVPKEVSLRPPRLRPTKEMGGTDIVDWAGTTKPVPVVGGEFSRRLKIGAHNALNKLPPDFKVLGEWARYERAVTKSLRRSQAGILLKVLPWWKISKNLSQAEGIALTLRVQFPTEGLLKSYQQVLIQAKKTEDARVAKAVSEGKKVARRADVPDQRYIDFLSDPSVLKYFREPSEEMINARIIAKEMDDIWVNELVRAGVLSRDQAEWIRWEPSLVATGARYKSISKAEAKAAGIPQKLLDARGYKILEAPEGLTLDEMINNIRREAINNAPENKLPKGYATTPRGPASTLDDLNRMGEEMMAREPNIWSEPMYYPHMTELKDVRIPRVGGGMVVPKSPVEMRSGVLELAGRMILDPAVWTQKFLENGKFLYYNQKHAELVVAAMPVDVLPNSNWRFITRKNERIQQLERTSTSFEEYLDNVKKELGDDPFAAVGKTGTESDLLTGLAEEAQIDAATGKRLAIPTKTAKKIIGDYTRSNNMMVRGMKDITTMWRAFVLNLRVGWLMNNILGNTLLYAIKNAGPEGIRSYVQAVGDALGEAGVRKLWNDKEVRSHLTPADMIELFPEQYVGTFFGTQIPTYGKVAGFKAFTGKYSPFRALRSVDVYYEQALRRAMINKLVRRSPEFKKVWSEMPQTTRTVREAQRTALKNNPRLVRRVTQEVNDALGDFFNMSDFEQRVLRGAAPFYAWYRAITTIMLKMPLDAPFRTAIMVRLGELGDQIAADDYGLYYLKGGYSLGGNTMLRTKSANPFSTPIDVSRGIMAGLLPGRTQTDTRTLTGMFNPIWYEPLAALERASTGQSYSPNLGPIPGGFYEVGRGLPQSTLLWPYQSKLYQNQTRLRDFLTYLGISIKDINEVEARQRAAEGR